MTKEELRTDLVQLFDVLKPEIADDYRAPDCEDDDEPSMQVTIATDDTWSGWSYQTGDNSFTGGAYGMPHWAVLTLDRDSDSGEMADDAISQLEELIEQPLD